MEQSIVYGVIIGAPLVLLGCGYLFVMFRAMKHEQNDLKNELKQIKNDLSALCNASATAGNRVVGTEQQLRRLKERQDQMELRGGNQKSYSQAIQMAQKGISAKELVLNCGITQGEADLLTMLHSMPQAS